MERQTHASLGLFFGGPAARRSTARSSRRRASSWAAPRRRSSRAAATSSTSCPRASRASSRSVSLGTFAACVCFYQYRRLVSETRLLCPSFVLTPKGSSRKSRQVDLFVVCVCEPAAGARRRPPRARTSRSPSRAPASRSRCVFLFSFQLRCPPTFRTLRRQAGISLGRRDVFRGYGIVAFGGDRVSHVIRPHPPSHPPLRSDPNPPFPSLFLVSSGGPAPRLSVVGPGRVGGVHRGQWQPGRDVPDHP